MASSTLASAGVYPDPAIKEKYFKGAVSFVIAQSDRLRKRTERILLRALFRPKSRPDLRKLGNRYGGWVVPTSLLTERSICYCVGVGLDVTFDMALIDMFGCEVFAFDPTPRAIEYVESHVKNVPEYRFFDVGLWSRNETLRFYAPANSSHVSHSVVNLQRTTDYFEARCKRLSSIMRDLGHKQLDLLKIDIEGAEYEVIESILEDQLAVRVLCVEYDQPTSPMRIWRSVKKLERSGFQLVNIDSWNYTFVQSGKGG